MTCSCNAHAGGVKIISFPQPNNIEQNRMSARQIALGGTKSDIFTETLYATTNSGLFASAAVIGPENQSRTNLGVDGPEFFGIGGALATIGSAVIPAIANIAVDVIKNLAADDAEGPGRAAVEAVLQMANVGPNPVLHDIARYRFDVTPTAVMPVEPQGGPSLLGTDGANVPSYLMQVAPCLAAKGGGALLTLLQNNVSELNGFSYEALQHFLKRILADAGEMSVGLVVDSVRDCL